MSRGNPILRDLVPPAAVVLTPTTTLRDALGMLDRDHLPAAPVIVRGTPVGVVVAGDIDARLARAGMSTDGDGRDGHTVEEVMTRRVVVLPPQADVNTALRAMREIGVGYVIVMDAYACLGLVSVAEALARRTLALPQAEPC